MSHHKDHWDSLLGAQAQSITHQPPNTGRSILSLPPEIILEIVSHLKSDRTAAASLALASKRCRDFVCAVRPLSFSSHSVIQRMEMVFRLAAEVVNRLGGQTQLTVGAFIRKIRLSCLLAWPAPVPNHMSSKEDIQALQVARRQLENTLTKTNLTTAEQGPTGKARMACVALANLDLRPCRVGKGGTSPHTEYTETTQYARNQHVICTAILAINRLVMYNLEILEWNDHGNAIKGDIWPVLNDKRVIVRHLKLTMPMGQWRYIRVDAGTFRLESIKICSQMFGYSKPYPPETAAAIDRGEHEKALVAFLTACAPDLRDVSLEWRDDRPTKVPLEDMLPDKRPPHPQTGFIKFPSIRTLHLHMHANIPKDVAWSLLKSPARNLVIHNGYIVNDFGRCLRAGMGQLPTLESIVIPGAYCRDPATCLEIMRFLDEHRGLKSIEFRGEDIEVIEDEVIPLLSDGGFVALTKLSLTWIQSDFDDDESQFEVSDSALAGLGKIESLEELTMMVNIMDSAFHRWKIDHDLIRHLLQPLRRLRALEFSRDSVQHLLGETYVENGRMSVSVSNGQMRGHLRDMTLLRARPDLDEECLNCGRRLGLGEVWQNDKDADEDHSDRLVGPVRDPYCALSRTKWFKLMVRNALLEEADAYAVVFPKLEKLTLGGLSMEIKCPRGGRHGNAVPTRGAMNSWRLSELENHSGSE